MLTTVNPTCKSLSALLIAHGVHHVVVSPGSRNAAPILAMEAQPELKVHCVVDERSAAFMALGMALTLSEPVALLCTSGTAIYNYAPAVAEAYYRRIPLIVVSADRPRAWIGQDDSQTLIQPGALQNIVKYTYSLMGVSEPEALWFNQREINDAVLTALTPPAGPVHINLPVEFPFHDMEEFDPERLKVKIVRMECHEEVFPVKRVRELSRLLASPVKVMIVTGYMAPDNTMRKALSRLAAMPNIVVVTEPVANLGAGPWISDAESVLRIFNTSPEKDQLRPDVIISVGGAVVSGVLKSFLRKCSGAEHWYVGQTSHLIDCYRHLSQHISAYAPRFMQQLASAMQPHKAESGYSRLWNKLSRCVRVASERAMKIMPWCDLTVFRDLLPMIPYCANLHLSNGMTIRYAQLIRDWYPHRVDCNRGVSGIDGSTSTAIGASLVYTHGPTVLITGDMSALYDIGSVFSGQCNGRFKMVVINNGGGEIFRIIESTRKMPVTSHRLSAVPPTDWLAVGRAAGFECFSADNSESLREGFLKMLAVTDRPSILIADTSGSDNASLLSSYRTLVAYRTHILNQ